MNQDNYTNYDFYLFMSDYCKINLVILDIINYKYLYIPYHDNNLLPDNTLKDDSKMFIIVKYTNNIFLPIMNSNGQHSFDKEILDIIKTQFELDNHKFNTRTNSDMFNVDLQEAEDNLPIVNTVTNLGIDEYTSNPGDDNSNSNNNSNNGNSNDEQLTLETLKTCSKIFSSRIKNYCSKS